MIIYWLIVWLNVFWAALPFLSGVHATWFHVLNAVVALVMIWRAPVQQGS